MMDQLINQTRGFSFGQLTYEKGGIFGPILRPYLVVLAIDRGHCIMRSDLGTLTLNSGEIALMAGNKIFEFKYKKDIPTDFKWCEAFLPQQVGDDTQFASEKLEPIATSDRLRHLFEIGLNSGHGSSADLNGFRDALGIALCRGFLLEARKDQADRKMPAKILTARSYIEQSLGNNELCVEKIAKHVGMTPQHLVSTFKRNIGMTPGKYIWHTRATRARQLLIHTGLSQAQIAYDCGYKSLAHFSRSIKAKFGETPKTIRVEMGFVRSSDLESSVKDIMF